MSPLRVRSKMLIVKRLVCGFTMTRQYVYPLPPQDSTLCRHVARTMCVCFSVCVAVASNGTRETGACVCVCAVCGVGTQRERLDDFMYQALISRRQAPSLCQNWRAYSKYRSSYLALLFRNHVRELVLTRERETILATTSRRA